MNKMRFLSALLLGLCVWSHVSAQAWTLVGSAAFSADSTAYTSIATDRAGTPYVAYSDASNGWKATVMKYNGVDWVAVGSTGFSSARIYNTTLAIDSNGIPYVGYEDSANSNKATVVSRFNLEVQQEGYKLQNRRIGLAHRSCLEG